MFTVFLDACVLYPAPLRDLLVQLAVDGFYRAKWSNRIHEEWIRNALNNNTKLTRNNLELTKKLMNKAVLDCLVEGYEQLESLLKLPDENDKHVLAAAIFSSSEQIITFNIKDFPKRELAKYNIKAQIPDVFISQLLDIDTNGLLGSVRSIRKRLKKPPFTANEYLEILKRQGLKKSVIRLEKYEHVI